MRNIRERILTVATLLFETRGIQASGVDMIIAESGVAKSTLYKYFPTKNQLIMAYLREKSDRFYQWLDEKLLSKKKNSHEILYELCDLLEEWISTPEFRGLPFHVGSVEFPEPTHPINHYSVELSNELQHHLAKIVALAGINDPDTLGQQLAIIFEGAALIERLSPGSGAPKRAKYAALTLIQALK